METLLVPVVGAMTGSAAGKVHHYVDGGWWLNLLAGVLGGYLGRAMFADALAPSLADNEWASIAVAAALGGALCAVLAGAARRLWGRQ